MSDHRPHDYPKAYAESIDARPCFAQTGVDKYANVELLTCVDEQDKGNTQAKS